MTKSISRTITVTIISGFNFVEREDGEITKKHVKVTLPGRLTEKECPNIMDRIVNVEHKAVKYAMPLDKFVELAEVVPDKSEAESADNVSTDK